MTLDDSLKAVQGYFEMLNRAAKVREARRLERMFPGADRTLPFRSGGQSYLFARMPDGKILAALNGRVIARPPKAIARLARHLMAQADVRDVHGL
jgi:hypothetical protein